MFRLNKTYYRAKEADGYKALPISQCVIIIIKILEKDGSKHDE